MTRTALYLQSNEEICEELKKSIMSEDVELYTASSAEDAFSILDEQDIMVVLVDCYIKDMKLFDFIKESIRKYPDTMLNICVDVMDFKMVTTIANIKQVKKLYMESWDIPQISEGLVATLDQACLQQDYKRRQQALREDKEQFEKTIDSLKEALLKQRFSYNKLEKVLNPYMESVIGFADSNLTDEGERAQWEALSNFVKYSCKKMLRVMTTIKFDVDGLSQYLTEELQSVLPKSGRIKLGNVSSCIIGNPDRDKLALLVFDLWLIALYQGYRMKSGTVSIDSYFLDSMYARFEICVSGVKNEAYPDRIHEYVSEMLKMGSEEFIEEEGADSVKYVIDFKMR